MHLRDVEIFCEIVCRRSFSKAAEVHEVSQPSATQAVQSLEKRVGTQLIDRSKRPLELTPAGEVYYEGCRELLDGFRRVEDRVRDMQNKVMGRVRIAAIYSIGLLEMDAYVRRFKELYPDTELQLEYLHPDEVYSRVLNDEADFGLVSFPRDGGEIACIPWQEQEMVVVASPEHPLARKSELVPADLQGENFVGFTRELTIRKQIDRWFRIAKIGVNVVHVFDNIENIKRAVEIGSGISLLPSPTVRRECSIRSLCAISLRESRWCRPLGIVHKRHKGLSTPASKLVELLQEAPGLFTEGAEPIVRPVVKRPDEIALNSVAIREAVS